MKEILAICAENKFPPAKVCTRVPQATKQNAVYVVDSEKVDHRDLTVDDNSIYDRHWCPTEMVRLQLDHFSRDSVSNRQDQQ